MPHIDESKVASIQVHNVVESVAEQHCMQNGGSFDGGNKSNSRINWNDVDCLKEKDNKYSGVGLYVKKNSNPNYHEEFVRICIISLHKSMTVILLLY